MLSHKIARLVLGAVLVLSLVPIPAIAEAVEEAWQMEDAATQVVGDEQTSEEQEGSQAARELVARIAYFVAAEDKDVEWTSLDSLEQAEALALAADGSADQADADSTDADVALNVRLLDAEGVLELRSRTEDEWADTWLAAEGELANQDGDSSASDASDGASKGVVLPLRADVQMRLSGNISNSHNVWYRVCAAQSGWLEWAHDGESALWECQEDICNMQVVLVARQQSLLEEELRETRGSQEGGEQGKAQDEPASEQSEPAQTPQASEEAIEVQTQSESGEEGLLVAETEKTSKSKSKDNASAVVTESTEATAPSVRYRAHVQGKGWMKLVKNGATAGTVGEGKRLEAISISLPKGVDGQILYRARVQTDGWMAWAKNGATAGTVGKGKRLEAVRIKLAGNVAKTYDVWYRVHVQGFGWLGWAKNNEVAGNIGLSKRVEAIQVLLVAKGDSAPKSSRSKSMVKTPTLRYVGHVQSYGWMSWQKNGKTCGTKGEGKRLEALRATASGSGMTGQVKVNVHAEKYGWLGYVNQGEVAGLVGKSKRLEALCVKLTGELKQNYDVWYRVRVQGIGWMGWAKNGQKSGTQSLSLRVEAVQMKLVQKGGAAPGSTKQAFVDGSKVAKLGYQNPSGYYQVSARNVRITSAAQAPWNYVTPSRIGIWATRKDCVNAFIQRAREYVGSPYVWNYSCAPGVGVDCIGLVYQCAYACGMDLGGGTDYDDFNPWAHYITGNSGWHSHDANNFWNYGKALHVPLSSRRAGDVIWWPGHVAIYLGNDQIIEAYTPATGVIYSGLYDHAAPSGCIRLFQ